MLEWINRKRNNKGFTLVELIIVIAILGILMAIAVPKFSKTQKKAEETALAATIKTLNSAVSLYMLEETETSSLINAKDASEAYNELVKKEYIIDSVEDDTLGKIGWENCLFMEPKEGEL
jgi:prepilin-type N-terminal cleavage/methylation domain-containing protein